MVSKRKLLPPLEVFGLLCSGAAEITALTMTSADVLNNRGLIPVSSIGQILVCPALPSHPVRRQALHSRSAPAQGYLA